MAPDRTSRNGGSSLPAKRNSALATAAMASAALLSQTGSAAADEGPSLDEVSRRVTNLYDRAETDSGTYNATRAAGTASSIRGRAGSATGGGRGTGAERGAGGEPTLDDIAKQWYSTARAKLGPTIEATLPSDRVAARSAQTRRQRPAAAPAAREAKPDERSLPELAAKPMLALPSAPETAPAALPAVPAQSPAWAPEPAPQDLTGTGEMLALGTSQLVPGAPEYASQPVAGAPEYTAQTETAIPAYTAQPDTAIPPYTAQVSTGYSEYSPQTSTGLPGFTGQLSTGLPEYTAQTATGIPDHSGRFGTGLPAYATQATTGLPAYAARSTTRFPDYSAQTTTGFSEYTAQPTPGHPGYTAQPTPGHPGYAAQLTAPLTALTPPPVDSVQSLPAIPAPRAPEPDWQALRPTAPASAAPATVDPASTLPTADPGYDSKVIQVLAFARTQIGKPCVWGAVGPGSYDNSGLTQAAWKVAGVSLPRTSLGQASTGTAVPLYAMQPGDLVFFHDDFSHVGLCTGNGMMIHAPGPGSSIREESIYPTGESIIRGATRPV